MSALWFQRKKKFGPAVLCCGKTCKSSTTKSATWFVYILDHEPVPLCNDCKALWEAIWDDMYLPDEEQLPNDIKELISDVVDTIRKLNPKVKDPDLNLVIDTIRDCYVRDKHK